jgi:hypothetical protein
LTANTPESNARRYPQVAKKCSCIFWPPNGKMFCWPIRPCVINSMFRVPWDPEIHARALPTQHKLDFYCRYVEILCWEFSQSWKIDELCICH